MIWKLLMVAEGSFRKVNAPELMEKVARGATYRNGLRTRSEPEGGKVAA